MVEQPAVVHVEIRLSHDMTVTHLGLGDGLERAIALQRFGIVNVEFVSFVQISRREQNPAVAGNMDGDREKIKLLCGDGIVADRILEQLHVADDHINRVVVQYEIHNAVVPLRAAAATFQRTDIFAVGGVLEYRAAIRQEDCAVFYDRFAHGFHGVAFVESGQYVVHMLENVACMVRSVLCVKMKKVRFSRWDNQRLSRLSFCDNGP